ncbi:hypothetical protein KKG52_02875 [Patescibacteria group bacterium]|nr:hypothetical protein [Patescibacteria group bacterium]
MEKKETVLKSFDSASIFTNKFIILLFAMVISGVLLGYFLATSPSFGPSKNLKEVVNKASVKKGTVAGSDDLKTFKDITEGNLKEGGVDGEGAFHLERPGGISQNVYLTSSIVDLGKYVGKKIKVWGQTQKAQKAGWLMDVGRIEVL